MAHKHQWKVADTYKPPGYSGKFTVTWACTCGAFKNTTWTP
jgi:hypothetical protein